MFTVEESTLLARMLRFLMLGGVILLLVVAAMFLAGCTRSLSVQRRDRPHRANVWNAMNQSRGPIFLPSARLRG